MVDKHAVPSKAVNVLWNLSRPEDYATFTSHTTACGLWLVALVACRKDHPVADIVMPCPAPACTCHPTLLQPSPSFMAGCRYSASGRCEIAA